MRDFFVFTMITKTRPWRHVSRHKDSKTKKLRHQDSKTKKQRHRDSKTKKLRHRDSKAKKPQHRVPVEFWPLCPLIDFDRLTLGVLVVTRCVQDGGKQHSRELDRSG